MYARKRAMSEHMPEQTQDKATVLVVDDDQVLRRQLFWALDGEHHVLEADSRASAIAQLENGRVQVVLCDLHLPPDLEGISEGLAIIEAARAMRPSIPVVVITGSNSRQSELFGHEKGAFTGATGAKKGRFELADGGTLFLDEIGELSQAVQVKLLRVLQERSFERLGGTKTLTVDIRLVAASNRDLEQEVEEGRFRRDLFYRLNVVPLQLPALRERREDLPILAAHFAARAAEKHGRPTPALDPALLEALQEYDWPGNVRELENLMERLVVLTTGTRLDTEFLPDKMLLIHRTADATTAANGEESASEATLEGAMLALKRRLVASALNAEGGNKAAAAKRLAISRSYLHRLISELDIS
ncbi:MAG: sigma-54 dependent transcriptional regulator [Acidobacteria bacterium]|nr:sigma-54 dependent transcriptional regulator [Acidobacteriota bacterium]